MSPVRAPRVPRCVLRGASHETPTRARTPQKRAHVARARGPHARVARAIHDEELLEAASACARASAREGSIPWRRRLRLHAPAMGLPVRAGLTASALRTGDDPTASRHLSPTSDARPLTAARRRLPFRSAPVPRGKPLGTCRRRSPRLSCRSAWGEARIERRRRFAGSKIGPRGKAVGTCRRSSLRRGSCRAAEVEARIERRRRFAGSKIGPRGRAGGTFRRSSLRRGSCRAAEVEAHIERRRRFAGSKIGPRGRAVGTCRRSSLCPLCTRAGACRVGPHGSSRQRRTTTPWRQQVRVRRLWFGS